MAAKVAPQLFVATLNGAVATTDPMFNTLVPVFVNVVVLIAVVLFNKALPKSKVVGDKAATGAAIAVPATLTVCVVIVAFVPASSVIVMVAGFDVGLTPPTLYTGLNTTLIVQLPAAAPRLPPAAGAIGDVQLCVMV